MKFRTLFAAVLLALAACSQPAGTVKREAPPAEAPVAQKAPTDADGRPLSYPMIGQKMPAFTAERAGGGMFTSAELNGKWTVIEFWGVWCGDCMNDAPHTAAFARAVEQDSGLRFITVHVDTRSGRWPSVQAYLSEKGVTYPVLMDPDREIYHAFQMQWVPTYLVVDPNGVIRGFRTDLSKETAPEGGVKAFMQQIATLRAAHAG
jgi:peroxiredoxin